MTPAVSECAIPGCGKPVRSWDWCSKHYMRWYRTGDPLGIRVSPPEQRFWIKVRKDAQSGCWLWIAALDRLGYGSFKRTKAHRWAYEHFVGPIPAGRELDHLCRNRSCVNPDHLEPVTHAENMARGANAVKTHCPAGHGYEQTARIWHGRRHCRLCNNAASRRYRERLRECK